jgi:hypothetical protein
MEIHMRNRRDIGPWERHTSPRTQRERSRERHRGNRRDIGPWTRQRERWKGETMGETYISANAAEREGE